VQIVHSWTSITDLIFNLCYRVRNGEKYRRWNSEDTERALEAVRKGDDSLNTASRELRVPKSVLRRHLNDGYDYFATQEQRV
jgi:hypothetical protein